MEIQDIVFATKSNGAVSIEDFKSDVKKKAEKFDLTYKDGSFTIAPKFLENQTALQGWNVAFSGARGQAWLVQNSEEEAFDDMKFLQGSKATRKFRSKAIEFALSSVNIDKDAPMYLTPVDYTVKKGTIAYEITNAIPESVVPVVETTAVEEPQVIVQEEATSVEPVVEEITAVPAEVLATEVEVENLL